MLNKYKTGQPLRLEKLLHLEDRQTGFSCPESLCGN
jgi:hypothetical protein